jgi:hypothetical protein
MCFNFFESRLKRNAREVLIRKLAYFNPIFSRFSGLIGRNVNLKLTFDKKSLKIEKKSKNFAIFLMS